MSIIFKDIIRQTWVEEVKLRRQPTVVPHRDALEVEKTTELTPQITDNARRAIVKIAMAQSLFSDQNSADADEIKLNQQKGFDLLNEAERELRKVVGSVIVEVVPFRPDDE